MEKAHGFLILHEAEETTLFFGTKYKIGREARRYELRDQTFLEISTNIIDGIETIDGFYLAPSGQSYPGKLAWVKLKQSGKLQKKSEILLQ